MGRRYRFHALQGLQAALGLTGLGGLGPKTTDKGLNVGDLPLLAREQGGLLGHTLGPLLLEG